VPKPLVSEIDQGRGLDERSRRGGPVADRVAKFYLHRGSGGREAFDELYEAERQARPGDHIEKVARDGTSECVEVKQSGWPWALNRDYILLPPGSPCPPQ